MADAHNAVCLNSERNSFCLPSQNNIVASWLLDYYCLVFWEEFKNERTVDKLTERNFLTGLLKQDLDVTEQRMVIVTLIQFVVCLVDGVDVNAVYNEEQDETPLEIALKHLDILTDECNIPGIDLQEIKNSLKIQAIITCCRAEQFDLAQSVFHRIWDNETRPLDTKQQNMQKRLRTFVSNKRVPPRFLEQHTYETFLDQVTFKLQEVWDQFDVPFLLQAVRRREQQKDQLTKESDDEFANNMSIEPSSSRQNSGNSSCTSSPIKGFRRFRELSRASPILQLNDSSDHYLSAEESEMDTGETVTDKKAQHSVEENPGPSTSKLDEDIALGTETYKSSTPKNKNNCNRETSHSSRLFTESALKKSLSRLELTQVEWREIKTTRPENPEKPSPRANGIVSLVMQRSRKKRLLCNSQLTSLDTSPKPPPCKVPNLSRSPKTPLLTNDKNPHQATAAVVNGESSPVSTEKTPVVTSTNDDEPTTSFDPSNDERPKRMNETPKRGRTIRGLKYQPNRIVDQSKDAPKPSVWSDFSDDDDKSSSEHSYPILDSHHVRRSLNPSTWRGYGQKLRPLRRPWSVKEVALLKKAVKEFGVGRWCEILYSYNFKGRTNVNLKDKWRTLIKNGET